MLNIQQKTQSKEIFKFTFKHLEQSYLAALHAGYDIISCQDYVAIKPTLDRKILVARVDIDFSVKKSKILAEMFNRLGVKATFFVRLHAHEYNPFSFENYKILKFIRDAGHEIGYHSEIVDQSVIWNENISDCLRRDIAVLNCMLDINVVGVASHGGMTGLNNLDFWKDKTAKDFDLLYEAYDTQPAFDLMNHSFFVSDSCWTYWKCYQNGKRCENDKRHLIEHIQDGHPVLYSLIHPDTYYHEHFYE